MTDISTVSVDFHVKRYSDFDLLRIARAVGQGYEDEVTAFLVNVQIHACSAVGVVYGHARQGPYGRFSDGHLIRTSDIQKVEREGRFLPRPICKSCSRAVIRCTRADLESILLRVGLSTILIRLLSSVMTKRPSTISQLASKVGQSQ